MDAPAGGPRQASATANWTAATTAAIERAAAAERLDAERLFGHKLFEIVLLETENPGALCGPMRGGLVVG